MKKFNGLRSVLVIDDLQKLEQKYNFTFPEQYKSHLVIFNGGSPDQGIFSFSEDGKETNSRVNYFYAINSKEIDDLEEILDTFKIDEKRMPEQILPIAEDPFGNVVCISTGKLDHGQIYFWDHEKEVDYSVSDDRDYSNLYLIAKSFNEFIDGLKDNVSDKK